MLPVAVEPYGMRAEQICEENEEEQRHRKRNERVAVGPDVWQDDLIPDEQNDRFDAPANPLACPLCAVWRSLLMAAGISTARQRSAATRSMITCFVGDRSRSMPPMWHGSPPRQLHLAEVR